MFEDILYRQLTSLSSLKHLRDFVFWYLNRESHQQTHIKLNNVRIKFNVNDSKPPELIKSHHFINFLWLRYQISNEHCVIKTLNCVFNYYLFIFTSIFFIFEILYRYNIQLATRLFTNYRCYRRRRRKRHR